MKRRLLFTAAVAAATVLLAASAVNAQAPQIASLPDGMFAIHYNRPAGDYKDWGLHVWESFDKIVDGKPAGDKTRSDRPLAGVGWGTPMPPTGEDGFGVYWHIKADEFRNGKVNYIIHRYENKNCAGDMYFMLTETKEVFVNRNDCKYFTTAEAAIKARQ